MKRHKSSTHASLLIAITAAAFVSLPSIASAAEPWGTWVRPSTGTQVNFYSCGGKLCAKITAVKDQSRSNTVGTVIMTGAAKSADSEWRGDLLNTEDGKTYSGVVTLEGAGGLRLEGCALGGMICKGETWQKVK